MKVAGSPAASAKTGRESSAWPSSCVYLTSLVWGDDVRRAKDVFKKYKCSADGKHVEASAAARRGGVVAAATAAATVGRRCGWCTSLMTSRLTTYPRTCGGRSWACCSPR